MPTIPNLSKLTLIETEPTGVRPFAELPPELDAMILKILMESYKGPREVCTGLRVMMESPALWARTPIGTLLGALAKDPLVQEQLWRGAFLKYFGLAQTTDDSEFEERFGATKWSTRFSSMCGEMELFELAQSPQTRIKLDWKNNASWTPYESDEMLAWLKRKAPFSEEFETYNREEKRFWLKRKAPFSEESETHNREEKRFDSPTMQTVLTLRYASYKRQKKRTSNNNAIFVVLDSALFQQFLEIAGQDPMKDVDLSPPVAVGTFEHGAHQQYHRVISTLTRQMLNGGIVSAEAIKTSDYPRVLKTLVEKMGASPNVKDVIDYVPLCTAIAHGDHVAVVDLLMELGASTEPDVDPSFQGLNWTPLMIACRFGDRLSCVQTLLLWGADVNASRQYGRTPLLIACEHCKSVGLVRMLLENNADPKPFLKRREIAKYNLHNEYRGHPLALARLASDALQGNKDQIIELLEDYEAYKFEDEGDDVRLERHRDRKQQAVFFKKEDV